MKRNEMIDDTALLRIYKISIFAKALDDKVQHLVTSGAIKATWFSWRGSELLGAAVGISMRPDDYMVAYYRDSMSQMAKGSSPEKLFAEALGKVTGTQRGKSGWVHSVDFDANVVMNSGIVGAQMPIAAGWALSSVLRGDDKVTVCNLGDGAVNEGAFHESLTLASLWKLPVVYVCHNNLYAEHTSFAKMSPVAHVADRAVAYNIPAVTVDGDDVVATWDALTTAIDRARTGDGPTLVEAMTYRLRGHTRFDTMGYIPEGEVAARLEDDPVPRFRAWLFAEGHASEDELAVIDKQALVDVEAAWKFANDSPYPDIEELYTDVFASA
jgi:pyruvate dehydrogenase E1 component alpha subunit